MSNQEMVQIVCYIPKENANELRLTLSQVTKLYDMYDSVSHSTPCICRFRPLPGSNPAIGVIGELTVVEEEKIEVSIYKSKIKEVVQAILSVHPYETPVILVIPFLDYRTFI